MAKNKNDHKSYSCIWKQVIPLSRTNIWVKQMTLRVKLEILLPGSNKSDKFNPVSIHWMEIYANRVNIPPNLLLGHTKDRTNKRNNKTKPQDKVVSLTSSQDNRRGEETHPPTSILPVTISLSIKHRLFNCPFTRPKSYHPSPSRYTKQG